jgi:hypothetical protein
MRVRELSLLVHSVNYAAKLVGIRCFQYYYQLSSVAGFFFFLGWCYSYGPQQGPDRQQKKEERGLKQRRKQKEAVQGDPEPKKGNQEKEKKIK